MNEDNKIVFSMEYEDGTSGLRELLSIFTADNEQEYAALLPLNEDGSEREDASIELVRLNPFVDEDGYQDYRMEGIDTDEEFQIALRAFEGGLTAAVEGEGGAEDEDAPLTLTIPDKDGNVVEWSVVDVFDHYNRKYIALIPMEGVADDEDIGIYLMRLNVTGEEGFEECDLMHISSDMEYDAVVRAFEARMAEIEG